MSNFTFFQGRDIAWSLFNIKNPELRTKFIFANVIYVLNLQGEGYGTRLQYCRLENPMDGGAYSTDGVACGPWGR